jgi:hypothetical protein
MRFVRSSRFLITTVTLILLIAAALAIYGAFRFNWKYGLDDSDRATVVNTVISGCSLALVGWGVIVALAAYVSATARPDLVFELVFNFSAPNRPVFKAAVGFPEPGQHTTIEPFKQADGRMILRNKSSVAARNPGVLIEFDGCALIKHNLEGWNPITFASTVGVTAIQWDGGADYIIHGRWRRTLPNLNFRGFTAYRSDPAIAVTIAADGFGPHTSRIPIKVLGPIDYDRYMKRVIATASKENPLPGPPPVSTDGAP